MTSTSDTRRSASTTTPQTAPVTLGTLLRHLRPYRGSVALIIGVLLLEVGTDLLKAWPLKFVIDSLTYKKSHHGGLRVHLPPSITGSLPVFLAVVSLAIILLSLLEGVASYFGSYLRTKVAAQVAAGIR